MNYSSHYTVLFSSLLSSLGCDFCFPTTVSALIAEEWKKNRIVESMFWRKRHYLLKERCRKWGKLSYTQRFSLIFRSSWMRGGYMQDIEHEVSWHARQLFSLFLHRCSWIIQQRGHRWGCMNAAISTLVLCALLPVFSLQIIHFVYTLPSQRKVTL